MNITRCESNICIKKDILFNLVLQELAKEGQKTKKAYQRILRSDTPKDYYFMQINYVKAVVKSLLNYTGYTQESNNIYNKKGNNLYSIANKYNTTVDEIKKKNNLTSNLLTIGQILII